jgi:diacylglycerol kinase (ATP)
LSRAYFVVNPAAANGRLGKEWGSILRSIKEEYSRTADFELTKGPGDATELARHALKEGYDVVASVGGDGTLNEVVNGFFEGGALVSMSASLGVLSLGTGSDFVKTLGIPRNLHSYLDTLKRGLTKRVDAVRTQITSSDGSALTRYYINVGEVGSGGAVVDKVNRTTKAFGGRISFMWGILTTLPRYKNKLITYSIDGGEEKTELLNDFVVANGRFFGGGLKPAPEALLDDGLLDVVTMGDFKFREVLFNIRKLMEGTHLSNPKVKLTRGRKVTVRCDEKILVEEDGEIVGMLPAEFEIIPGCISLIC